MASEEKFGVIHAYFFVFYMEGFSFRFYFFFLIFSSLNDMPTYSIFDILNIYVYNVFLNIDN